METPSESANFLPMVWQFHIAGVVSSKVSHKNRFVFAARSDDWGSHIVPSQWAYSCGVAFQSSNFLLLVYVPYLNLSRFGSDTEMCSSLWPAKRSNLVVLTDIAKLMNSWGGSVPKENWWIEGYSKNVLSWPVNEIQVEIVVQTRRLENPVRVRSDLPWLHCLSGQNGRIIEKRLVTIH